MDPNPDLDDQWNKEFPRNRRFGMWNTLFIMEFVNAIAFVFTAVIYSTAEYNEEETYDKWMWSGLFWAQFAFFFLWLTTLIFHISGAHFQCAGCIGCCRTGLGWGDSSLYTKSHWIMPFILCVYSGWMALLLGSMWDNFIMGTTSEEERFWENRDEYKTYNSTLTDFEKARVFGRGYGIISMTTVSFGILGVLQFASMYRHLYPDYAASAELKRYNAQRDNFDGAGHRSCSSGIFCTGTQTPVGTVDNYSEYRTALANKAQASNSRGRYQSDLGMDRKRSRTTEYPPSSSL